MRAPATPSTTRWMWRYWPPTSRRSDSRWCRSRARRRIGKPISCVPISAARSHSGSAATLSQYARGYDVAFVVADGLSASAVQQHAAPVLQRVVTSLPKTWCIAPLVIARFGRVALGDAIAEALQAECVAVLIGERPGLSAPDSMGAYLTYRPRATTTDADRNCISNIRPAGIGYDEAAFKLTRLLMAMRVRRIGRCAKG